MKGTGSLNDPINILDAIINRIDDMKSRHIPPPRILTTLTLELQNTKQLLQSTKRGIPVKVRGLTLSKSPTNLNLYHCVICGGDFKKEKMPHHSSETIHYSSETPTKMCKKCRRMFNCTASKYTELQTKMDELEE